MPALCQAPGHSKHEQAKLPATEALAGEEADHPSHPVPLPAFHHAIPGGISSALGILTCLHDPQGKQNGSLHKAKSSVIILFPVHLGNGPAAAQELAPKVRWQSENQTGNSHGKPGPLKHHSLNE